MPVGHLLRTITKQALSQLERSAVHIRNLATLSNGTKIVQLTDADRGTYKQHLAQLSHDDLRQRFNGKFNIDHYVDNLNLTNTPSFGLIKDDKLLGVANLNGSDAKEFTEISVTVSPDARNQGVAKQLLSHSIDFAQNQGYRQVYMSWAKTNHAIPKLASFFGFKTLEVGEAVLKLYMKP